MIRNMIYLMLLVTPLVAQLPAEDLEGAIQDQQMIGVLSASYLYQSYLNIGYLADATEGAVYSEEEALTQVDGLLNVIGGVRDELLAYSRQVESESDRLYLENLVKVADLLIQEASALLRYYESNDQEYAKQYMEFNAMAQKAIGQLLGVEAPE